jgi:small subunit ribosomal protein S1
MMQTLQEGQIVQGKVVSLQKFGAFVDIGGMQGLLPMSEIGWGRIENINDALKIGEEVEVAVLRIDRERDRISLSLKKLLADPWEKVESTYLEGSIYGGRVVRLTKFGAFIALEPGIDGLLHISRMGAGKRVSHAGEVLKEGQDLEVKIEKVDRAAKRISLLLAEHDAVKEEKEAPDDYRQYMKKTQSAFGSLGDQIKDAAGPGAKEKNER